MNFIYTLISCKIQFQLPTFSAKNKQIAKVLLLLLHERGVRVEEEVRVFIIMLLCVFVRYFVRVL